MDREERQTAETDANDQLTETNEHGSTPFLPVRKRDRLRNWGWTWECLCWILVMVALAAMVSVIATAQDQPMAAWRQRHNNISINAVVAVLSALLKGPCMYIVAEVIGQAKWQWFGKANRLSDFQRIDHASRGSWGSAKLLFRMRAPALALLGAFITVVAIAVDPFTQNIIAVRNCQTQSTNQTAFIPTADVYDTFLGWMPRNANPRPGDFALWGIDRDVPDAAMKAAVYSGLYGSSTTVINASTIRPHCPGVNCTFPRYTTLGVCHKCVDISSSIEKTCDPKPPVQDNVFRPRCKWSLPSGQFLQNYAESDTYYKWLDGNITDFSINFAIANSTASTVALPHVPGTFSNVTFLANSTTDPQCTIYVGNNCGNPAGVPTMELKQIAVECSLFPCARTYTASVVDGAVVETEVKRSVGQGNWLNYDWAWRQGPIPEDIRINPNEDCKSEWPWKEGVAPPCTYAAGSTFIMSLGNFFWSFWNGTMAGRHYSDAVSSRDILDILYGGGITNFTHVDRILGSISDSMTAAIRLTGRVQTVSSDVGGGQGKVTGLVMLADTCIDVRWGWFALPCGVAAFTFLLLFSIIVHDWVTPNQPAWKSSALPVLFHGLSATELASKGRLLTGTEMEKEASGLWVRLADETSGTLRLETCK